MEWRRGSVIGRGSSAAVSLATTADGEVFAVKSAEVSSSSSLQKEQFLISQLSSPFIVKCFGSDVTVEEEKSVYNVFLEYVGGGSLSDLIRARGGSLRESTIRFFANQMCRGLNYLHLRGFVHCDIKGQNILVGEEGVKIADFGCAKIGGESGSFAGSPAYMAPEAARGEEQGFPADIWALGCTVIEMATGANPWPEMKDPAVALYRIAYSGESPEIPTWLSASARDFLAKCLARNPRDRCTAAELLCHPFLDSAAAATEDCGGIEDWTRRSPTSVMDQHFWDSDYSDSNSLPDISDSDYSDSNSVSPATRIRELIGDVGFSAAAEEGEWMTVRGEECDEFEVESEGVNYYEDLIVEEFEEEDSLMHSYWGEISSIDVSSSFQFIIGDSDSDGDIHHSLNLPFERMLTKKKDFCDSNKLFDPIFSLAFSLYSSPLLFLNTPFPNGSFPFRTYDIEDSLKNDHLL